MTDEQRAGELRKTLNKDKVAESLAAAPPDALPAEGAATVSDATDPATPKNRSAEEQMALYEKELKDNDWGHQPC
jgi:hypothetical protein